MSITNLDNKRAVRKAWLSIDLTRATGISYRQLDYWVRTGLIPESSHPTSGSGDVRWFSADDALRCAIAAKLVQAGVGLATVRERIEEFLTSEGEALQMTPGVWLTVDVPAERFRLETYKRGPAA